MVFGTWQKYQQIDKSKYMLIVNLKNIIIFFYQLDNLERIWNRIMRQFEKIGKGIVRHKTIWKKTEM